MLEAINDPDKFVIVNTAPSIRATLGEAFGMKIGTNVEGKMVAALRRLGFDKVFDTDFAADLTIIEEANELVDRVKLSRAYTASLHLQITAADVRRNHENLVCKEAQYGPLQDGGRRRYAVHGKEIRDEA